MHLKVHDIDTPALLIDIEKVSSNIELAIAIAGSPGRLRPHVKTHKILEVANMQISKGISKFKCATIAEAEMLGMAGARDVLIAYPLQGPKVLRFIKLISKFPQTSYSMLVDNIKSFNELEEVSRNQRMTIQVYIDINNGQGRTGTTTTKAIPLIEKIIESTYLALKGLHIYDGHIHVADLNQRVALCKSAFIPVLDLQLMIENRYGMKLNIIAGGSPTFPVHAKYHGVECSPGTFVFWDEGYGEKYLEQPFEKAAILATRVISKVDEYTFCLDLGYKSVANEQPLPRVKFESNHDIKQLSQSEEHLVIRCNKKDVFTTGDLLFAYPQHVCPTVALYDSVWVVSGDDIIDEWQVLARKRKITV